MIWILSGLAVLFALDALRLRGRVSALPVLEASDAPVAADHQFVVAAGVTLDEATRRAASAHATARGAKVVDLIPADIQVSAILGLVQLVNPATFRRERFTPGRTSGHAMLVESDVLERAQLTADPPEDPVAFQHLAAKLKRFACTDMEYAVAPDLRALPRNPNRRRAVARLMIGELYVVPLLLPMITVAVLALGLIFAPLPGAIALGTYHLSAPLVFAGGPVSPRHRWWYLPFRSFLEPWISLTILTDRWQPASVTAAVDELRPVYAKLIEGGWERFFEERRPSCPLCGSDDLRKFLSTGDAFQQKPGRFRLDRCRGCGHIFQNPRLTIEGLDYYYRDFYDGIGEELTELIFANYGPVYGKRARMMRALTEPKRWLDVGCGHGHFCCAARDELEGVELHGLDMSESVEEALRRGWIDRSYRGLFPEIADQLTDSYDVVSMHHYLEHVLDPAAEIAAARKALQPGGYLLIEVPAPESRMGRFLGRLWVNWLQPQHLHFVSMKNLDRLLGEHGFTAVSWHRGEAHMPIDLMWAVIAILQRLGPTTDRPWKPPSTWRGRLRRRLVWTLGAPILGVASMLDYVFALVAGPLRTFNLYRVVARLDDPD